MIRWPFVSRSAYEADIAGRASVEADLRWRLFVLRENAKEAKRRIGFNLSLSENAAAYRVLDIALIRDLEADQ